MSTPFTLVQDFHQKFQLPVREAPTLLPALTKTPIVASVSAYLHTAETLLQLNRTHDDVLWGRVQMMIEEVRELTEALEAPRSDPDQYLADVADALIDLEYFVLGTCAMLGLPHDALFREVHRANMDKELINGAEESKRLNKLDVRKPEGWRPPGLAALIKASRAGA